MTMPLGSSGIWLGAAGEGYPLTQIRINQRGCPDYRSRHRRAGYFTSLTVWICRRFRFARSFPVPQPATVQLLRRIFLLILVAAGPFPLPQFPTPDIG